MLQTIAKRTSRVAAKHYRSKPFRMRNSVPLVSFTFDDVPDFGVLERRRRAR